MTLPPQAVTKARAALRAELSDLPPGSIIAVACSGGADSLAVVAELVFVARKAGWQTAAFLIDHAMQDGSAQITATAAHTCEQLGVDQVRTKRVTVATGSESGGPESAARTARYAALQELAADTGAAAVLLGHTIDDQAETVLLGLNRGSGTRSLAGMRPRIGIYRRPFLSLSRADTEAVCDHANITYWIDPTNLAQHDGPLRSQVRGRLIPVMDQILGPKIPETLARTAQQLQDDADALDYYAQDLLNQARAAAQDDRVELARKIAEYNAAQKDPNKTPKSSAITNETDVTLSVRTLQKAPRAVLTRALRQAAITAGTPAGTLKYSHIEQLEKLITNWHGQKPIDLPNAYMAWREGGIIAIAPPNLKDARVRAQNQQEAQQREPRGTAVTQPQTCN